jgi:MFS family permease
VSQTGTWVDTAAQAWLVLELTDSGTALGLAAAARFVPVLLLGPWGGVVTDRVDKRTLILVTQASAGVVATVLWLAVALGEVTMPIVYVLAVFTGIINVFDTPARQTILAELVGPDELRNAISLNSVVVNAARVVGPALAAVLIAVSGLGLCFAVNAVSYFAVLAMLALFRRSEMHVGARLPRSPRQLREGVLYLTSRRELLVPFVLIAIAGLFAWEFQITLPLMAKSGFHAGPGALAAMFGAMGAGAIVGGLIIGAYAHTRVDQMLKAGMVWGVFMLLAATAPTLTLVCVALFCAGFAGMAFNTLAKTLLQIRSEPAMRGRVMALWATAWVGSTAVGGPLVGWVGEVFGARWSLALGGLPTLVASAAIWAVARRRRVQPT